MDDIPLVLKPIQRILKVAQQIQKCQPLISHICKYYAVTLGKNLRSPTDKESGKYLVGLLDILEEEKTVLGDKLKDKDSLQEFYKNFTYKVFKYADDIDRDGKATKKIARDFLRASIFMEAYSYFESPIPEEMERMKAYAKWKTIQISKALENGEIPSPGPVGYDPSLDGKDGDELNQLNESETFVSSTTITNLSSTTINNNDSNNSLNFSTDISSLNSTTNNNNIINLNNSGSNISSQNNSLSSSSNNSLRVSSSSIPDVPEISNLNLSNPFPDVPPTYNLQELNTNNSFNAEQQNSPSITLNNQQVPEFDWSLMSQSKSQSNSHQTSPQVQQLQQQQQQQQILQQQQQQRLEQQRLEQQRQEQLQLQQIIQQQKLEQQRLEQQLQQQQIQQQQLLLQQQQQQQQQQQKQLLQQQIQQQQQQQSPVSNNSNINAAEKNHSTLVQQMWASQQWKPVYAEGQYVPTEDEIMEAMMFAKQILSSLQFEDTPAALAAMRKCFNKLTGQNT